jgi:hypothetical protein
MEFCFLCSVYFWPLCPLWPGWDSRSYLLLLSFSFLCLERNQGSSGGTVEPSVFLGLFLDLKLPFSSFKTLIWMLFTAQSWAPWNIRNKFSIEHKLPSQPADCFFKTSIFLQLWRPLLTNKLNAKLECLLDVLRSLYRQTRISSPRSMAAV